MSFFHIDMTQVVEILPQIRQGLNFDHSYQLISQPMWSHVLPNEKYVFRDRLFDLFMQRFHLCLEEQHASLFLKRHFNLTSKNYINSLKLSKSRYQTKY